MPDDQAIHTIPVPAGWSVEQAWEHIRRRHLIPEEIAPPEQGECPQGGSWANVLADAEGNLVRVLTC
jgi:hypothetical protein